MNGDGLVSGDVPDLRSLFESLTVKEYARLKGVSVHTVRRWIRVKWIDAERTAGEHGQWRIRVPRAQAS